VCPDDRRVPDQLTSSLTGSALASGSARDDAASTVLAYFFPDVAPTIDALADQLADGKSSAFQRGIGVGDGVGVRNDGSGAAVDGHQLPWMQACGGVAGGDDGGDSVFAGH